MLKYIQPKNIDFKMLEDILKPCEQSNQYTNSGPVKKRLEKKLEEILKLDSSRSVLCTTNGTVALHAIYFFLKQKKENLRIATPAYTFPSAVVATQNVSILDIDLDTYTIPFDINTISEYVRGHHYAQFSNLCKGVTMLNFFNLARASLCIISQSLQRRHYVNVLNLCKGVTMHNF